MSRFLAYMSAALLASVAWPIVAHAQADVEVASWLAGCWVAESGSARQDEVWMEPRGGMMVAMSRSVRDGSARGYELVVLHTKDGTLTYSAHPSGQNPADFGATGASPDVVRFENPEHDFPQAIEYVRVPPDSLVANVYAEATASEPAFAVRYARRPCPGGK